MFVLLIWFCLLKRLTVYVFFYVYTFISCIFFSFSPIQAKNDFAHAYLPDVPSRGASDVEFFAYVNLHDIQRMAMPGCRFRCCCRLLHVWMEKIRYSWYYRALPLIAQHYFFKLIFAKTFYLRWQSYQYEYIGIKCTRTFIFYFSFFLKFYVENNF